MVQDKGLRSEDKGGGRGWQPKDKVPTPCRCIAVMAFIQSLQILLVGTPAEQVGSSRLLEAMLLPRRRVEQEEAVHADVCDCQQCR